MSDTLNKVLLGASVGMGLLAAGIAFKAAMSSQGKPLKSFKSYRREDLKLNYIIDTSVKLHPVLQELQQATLEHPRAGMLGSSEQIQFLSQLVKNMGAKKTLDIGVFTGFSSLAIALSLPEDGRVVACDINDDFASVGKPFWKKAGVDKIIDLKIAPAAETLQGLLDNGEAGTYDYAFIDADKPGYITYYELALKLLRPGGVIALDNLLWGGMAASPEFQDSDTIALREINAFAASDPRVMYTLLPLGDGTGIAFKK